MADKTNLISSFYQDKCILITGATGFVGKVLVEKLLRSCSDVKTIYLLLRSKQGYGAKQRLEDLLKGKIFERVKKEHPNALSKLVAIPGDLTSAELGISASDANLLINNVSVVFHSAATVKFDEPLKKAVVMNVLGTRRLIELCHKMKKLEAMIYVSTAFCNCDRKAIGEMVYELPISPQKIINIIQWMDEDLVNVLAPHLMRGRPNTYIYTKALAENLLVEECGSLPVAIVRPSIVTAASKEPFPGWIDNYNGPTGFMIGASKGILRSMLCKSSCTADLIPVDIVINLVITVAWNTAVYRPQGIKVYNCTSGSINKITYGSMKKLVLPFLHRYPSTEIFRYPSISLTNSKIWNNLSVILHHHLPAYCLDLMSVIAGEKPKFVSMYKRMHQALHCQEYFLTHQWTFSCDNLLKLQNCLSDENKKAFNFNIESLHWPTYFEDYVLGIRQFILREEASSLPSARKHLKRTYLYSKLGYTAIVSIIIWMLRTRLIQIAR